VVEQRVLGPRVDRRRVRAVPVVHRAQGCKGNCLSSVGRVLENCFDCRWNCLIRLLRPESPRPFEVRRGSNAPSSCLETRSVSSIPKIAKRFSETSFASLTRTLGRRLVGRLSLPAVQSIWTVPDGGARRTSTATARRRIHTNTGKYTLIHKNTY
jgi:hypothetical protein